MSLLDLANQTLNNFDPSKDSIRTASGLPTGDYDVLLKAVSFNVSQSGYESIGFALEVVAGDHVGQTETIRLNLDPDFVGQKGYEVYKRYPGLLKNAIRTVSKIAWASGIELTDDDWVDMPELAQAFNDKNAIGQQFILKVDVRTNNAGKENRSYEFDIYDDALNQAPSNGEIDEDDLPF